MKFIVTTAETVYEEYEVEADSPEAARRTVIDPDTRSELLSRDAGGNADGEIIDVRPASRPFGGE